VWIDLDVHLVIRLNIENIKTLKKQATGQSAVVVRQNAGFFAENDWYQSNQGRLAMYRLIAQSAAQEVTTANRILDIGNGGIFIFPIGHIPRVEAIDIFVDASFSLRYPDVDWRQMSVLDLDDDDKFDTIIAINCLHHVIGRDVAQCYQNLNRIFEVTFRALQPGGKLVVLESTVFRWFLTIYKPIFSTLLKLWPLSHPPTFQYHSRDIDLAAASAGFKLGETTWIPKTGNIMTLGIELPGWLAPIRVGKFVYRKP
jgi:SAM-dependent methyltransferase